MPPIVYLQTIEEPILKGKTNHDLLAWAMELQTALKLANYDKLQLQLWLNGHEE